MRRVALPFVFAVLLGCGATPAPKAEALPPPKPSADAAKAPPDPEPWRQQRPPAGQAGQVEFPIAQQAKLKNGLTVLTVHKPTPVAAISLVFRNGAAACPPGKSGLAALTARMLTEGTRKHPGVKLAPAGITIRELIDQYCGGMLDGHELYAYLPGGASGGILPASMGDIPLDFDTLQPYGCFIGSAAVIVLSQHDTARQAAVNMMRFFAHESCGQCTPCRVGTAKAVQLMEQESWDNELLEDLSQVMVDASICGLGQAAPNPIRCVQKYFPQELGA